MIRPLAKTKLAKVDETISLYCYIAQDEDIETHHMSR